MINQKQDGISLLEVLITILVLAIGLLGVAALQLKTLTTTQESYSRSQAVAIVEDMTSRIRANRQFISSDPASTTVPGSDGGTIELANPYTANKNGEFYKWCQVGASAYTASNLCSGACNAYQLALSDIDNVCLALDRSGMNNATAGASCSDRTNADVDTCSPGSKLTLYVAWEQEQRNDLGEQQVSTRCQTALPEAQTGVGDGFSCVIMDLIP